MAAWRNRNRFETHLFHAEIDAARGMAGSERQSLCWNLTCTLDPALMSAEDHEYSTASTSRPFAVPVASLTQPIGYGAAEAREAADRVDRPGRPGPCAQRMKK